MRCLSLFTGAGGGLLGESLLGWKHIGYVENNTYCQDLLKQRIRDGLIDDAPIFGDIRQFIAEGYPELYKGSCDCVSAGFPCQSFSIAGARKGADDAKNMWPETLEVIHRVRPERILLENTAGLLTNKYVRTIFGDLVEAGYDARWETVSASDAGAPHRRERLWIMGYANERL